MHNKEDISSQLLSSSVITGISQIAQLLATLVRYKTIAVAMGPVGIATIGIQQSTTAVAVAALSLGLTTSAVPYIASKSSCEIVGDNTAEATFARLMILVASSASIVVFFTLKLPWISSLFSESTIVAAYLAAFVFFTILSTSCNAILQAHRAILELAMVTAITAVGGAISTVLVLILPSSECIALSFAIGSACGFAVSLRFSSRFWFPNIALIKCEDIIQLLIRLSSLGVSSLAANIMSLGNAWITRVLIACYLGSYQLGVFVAAVSLSNVFIQFILGAMGADFYPTMAKEIAARGNPSFLLNKQTELGLLLAFPGLAGGLVFTPLLLSVLFQSDFESATLLTQLLTISALGKVVSWPLGYTLLAGSKSAEYFIVEASFNVAQLGLVLLCLRLDWLSGIGYSQIALYITYTTVLLCIVNRQFCITWTASVWLKFLVTSVIATACALVPYLQIPIPSTVLGCAIFFAAICFTFRRLHSLLRKR